MNSRKKTRLTEWENEPDYDDLYSDYENAQDDHGLLVSRIDEYEEYMDGGPEISVPKGKSTVRPKLIRKQAEWKYPALEEPFLNTENMFRIKPRTFEDRKAAEQNELVLNYQWSTKIDKVSLVGDIVRGLVNDGTVIVKTGWEIEEKEIQVKKEVPIFASPEQTVRILNESVLSGVMTREDVINFMNSCKKIELGSEEQIVYEKVLVKNNPTYTVCDIRDVIIDPTCNGDISKAQFIIHEYDTDMSTLRRDEYVEEEIIDEDTGKVRIKKSGIYKNLDSIKVDEVNDEDDGYEYYHAELGEDGETAFEFEDEPRKKIRAYEYWGYWDIDNDGEVEPIVATWVGETLIRLEKNPFPFDGLPFSLAKYMPKKNEIYGEPDAELLKENQDSIGKMMRAAHDITSTQAVGQEFIDEQFFASPLQKNNYKSGKTVFFKHGMNPNLSIHKTTVDPVPRAVFDMISYHQNDAESMSGTKSFSQGIGSQSLGSVAVGIRSALDATAKRELSILRRLSEQIFKDIARKSIIMNQHYLEEEEVIRITNEEFVSINRKDLIGEFDLIIDVSTPEKDNEKAEKLNMLMQTNAASMDPNLAKIIYARIAKLWKEPDLAKEVEEYKPEANPVEEQVQKLRLENEMLKNQELKMRIAKMAKDIESEDSKIEERMSRVSQNITSETELNKAKAELDRAKANKLVSDKVLADIKAQKESSGAYENEKRMHKEYDHVSELEKLELKFKHQAELEALKEELRKKQDEINALEIAIIEPSDDKNNITVAEAEQNKNVNKSLDRISNINEKYNGV